MPLSSPNGGLVRVRVAGLDHEQRQLHVAQGDQVEVLLAVRHRVTSSVATDWWQPADLAAENRQFPTDLPGRGALEPRLDDAVFEQARDQWVAWWASGYPEAGPPQT